MIKGCKARADADRGAATQDVYLQREDDRSRRFFMAANVRSRRPFRRSLTEGDGGGRIEVPLIKVCQLVREGLALLHKIKI